MHSYKRPYPPTMPGYAGTVYKNMYRLEQPDSAEHAGLITFAAAGKQTVGQQTKMLTC